jgi:hypothetical protein
MSQLQPQKKDFTLFHELLNTTLKTEYTPNECADLKSLIEIQRIIINKQRENLCQVRSRVLASQDRLLDSRNSLTTYSVTKQINVISLNANIHNAIECGSELLALLCEFLDLGNANYIVNTLIQIASISEGHE